MGKTEKVDISLYNGEIDITFYPNSHMYKRDGKTLVSVSKISGIVDKSGALIHWAVGLTRNFLCELVAGNASAEFHDDTHVITEEEIDEACKQHTLKKEEAATTGKLVHEWVENYTRGQEIPMPEEEAAKNGILAFLKWKTDHNVEFEVAERLVYSKEHDYVGIFDTIIKVDGKRYLADYKTSKKFYAMEHGMQTAGYMNAYFEETQDYLDGRMILRFDKETGEFEVHMLQDYEADLEAFLAALILTKRQKFLDSQKGF